MKITQRLSMVAILVLLLGTVTLIASDVEQQLPPKPIAQVSIGSHGILWQPLDAYEGLVLTVSRPDGAVLSRTFTAGATPYFDLSDNDGSPFIDGAYTYELRVVSMANRKRTKDDNDLDKTLRGTLTEPRRDGFKALTQSGGFLIKSGTIVTGGIPEPATRQPGVTMGMVSGEQQISPPLDQVIADDLIVTGSLCVGFDCVNGENFGFDTLRLKENNLRIKFQDTSNSASFPSNDWQLTANDSANGGQNKFSIDDIDGGRTPFTIEAGAPSNSLYVDDGGRLGLGTSTPVVGIHTKDGNTPTLRLEQDGSSGFTPQTWDVAGNETNFFIRDATNGSTLPFRIQPGAPSNAITVISSGKVGIGTWSPAFALELETTGTAATFGIQRTDGATAKISAGSSSAQFGSHTNDPVKIMVNGSTMHTTFNTDLSLDMANGASCDTNGNWTTSSSREYKENIAELSSDEAFEALEDLTPVKYNYKADKENQYVGFIAEDVPDLVATKDRKGMIPMDVVGVLTRVLKDQQKMVKSQQETIAELKEKVSKLEKQLQQTDKK